MASEKRMKFGPFVRREREARWIGLRELSRLTGISPSYLSNFERNIFPPPAEDKIHKIAEVLNLDADELLAMAGRVSSDLLDIIREHPKEMAALLRSTKHAPGTIDG